MMKKTFLYALNAVFILSALIIFTACTPGKAQGKQAGGKESAAYERDSSGEELSFEDEDAAPSVKTRPVAAASEYDEGRQYDDESDSRENTYRKERYFQTGKASWYGREFHGKATASGEKFNMYDMTAAHKTLPFGTILEVKNLDTGKSVEVRINDRGPYRGKRILDLSYNAAKNLSMIKQGEAHVGIKILEKGRGDKAASDDEPEENPRTKSIGAAASGSDSEYEELESEENNREKSSRNGAYSIQAGAFYSNRNAKTLKDRIQDITDKKVTVVKDGDFFKVRVDGIQSRKDAESLKRRLNDKEINSYILEK